VVTGAQQRAAVEFLQKRFKVSQRRAARALGRSRSTVRYEPKARDDEAQLVRAVRKLARRHPRYGYRRIHARLVAGGWRVNRKRVRRLWAALGLKRRVRRKSLGRRGFPGTSANSCVARPATAPNDVWTCDFVQSRTVSGGSLKWLSVVDEYTREVLVLVPAATLSGADVRRWFGRLMGWRGRPRSVRCDNGGEFIGAALSAWLEAIGVELMPVAPASPWENGVVESFHGRLRDEFLDRSVFENVADAKAQAAAFKREFNTVRPHSGLGYKTPREFAATCGEAGKTPGRKEPRRMEDRELTTTLI
jgi:transposase InsO family protein